MPDEKKHVHFIGICGVFMAPVAKMFLDMGWQVSGSDAGIYPPMSNYLKANSGIKFYAGFHPEKIGQPDLVVVGNFIGPSNIEFKHIKEQNIIYKSAPEILEEYVIKENSIVIAGSYGKTTITSLLVWIFEQQGLNPSYMAGGILKNLPDGVRATDSKWSIVEGDEYPASRWQNQSKFFYYRPKSLILTSADWDHMDVFKTESSYVRNFKDLVAMVPPDGLILANKLGTNIEEVVTGAHCPVVYYKDKMGYSLGLFTRKRGEFFIVENKNTKFTEEFQTSLIGVHNLDNVLAAIALCVEMGFDLAKLKEAVKTFSGVKRRLEIRGYSKNDTLIIDDLAHSPVKAKSSILALRDWYPESRVFAVFEPNVGSRTLEAIESYKGKFDMATEVFIPRLSSTKSSSDQRRLAGAELTKEIKKTYANISYIDDDAELLKTLNQKTQTGDIIVFLGSHGFRGMIDELITRNAE